MDSQCCAGLDAVTLAAALVQSGAEDVVLAGGAESYSRRPMRYRRGADNTPQELIEQARFTPWADRDPDVHEAAAALANRLRIERAAQGRFAVASHEQALAAQAAGRLDAECFLSVLEVPAGATLSINFPVAQRREEDTILGVTYASEWHGDTVIRLSPEGVRRPLYRREAGNPARLVERDAPGISFHL